MVSLHEKLTILVPTSVIPSSPSTNLIHRSLQSIRKNLCSGNCSLIICLDHHGTERDNAYQQELEKYVCSETCPFPATFIVNKNNRGIGKAFAFLISQCKTPYYLLWEHDWEAIKAIDISVIIGAFESDSDLHYVRFNKRKNFVAGWDKQLLVDDTHPSVPLLITTCFSNNPHIARFKAWETKWWPILKTRPNNIENILHEQYRNQIAEIGLENASKIWGIRIYGRLGDPKTVHHLDGKNFSDTK